MREGRRILALAALCVALLLWRGYGARVPTAFAARASAAHPAVPLQGTHRLCCRHADVALAGMTIAVPGAACLLPCTPPVTRSSGLRNGRVVAIWHVDPLEPPPMRAEFG